jgi:hypothetical protein
MAKPGFRRVPSDDCKVEDGGELFYPHEGEWIECTRGLQVREMASLQEMQSMLTELDTVKGEPDEWQRVPEIMTRHYDRLIPILRDRVVRWNWTDDAGRPYPQPMDDPDVFRRLKPEELWYLSAAIRGETPGEQKNGGSGTPITSSATASQVTEASNSTTAPSRSRRS